MAMHEDGELLPSWRDGSTRQALTSFLDASAAVPAERRVAVFDNDGTLWCERPSYAQLAFFLDELRAATSERPSLADRPEYRALLNGDRVAQSEMGLRRLALALAELFAGMQPDSFATRCRNWAQSAPHPTLGRRYIDTVYRPMLELLNELRRRGFTVFVVTGGGTEFVRALSQELYGVASEAVIGSHVTYDVEGSGRDLRLRRGALLDGPANEGAAKITRIQQQLGRQPILAAGNTAGDREMLDYALAAGDPSLAILVHHDDDAREFAYHGEAVTVATKEPLVDTAARSDWTIASMRRDWSTVFKELT